MCSHEKTRDIDYYSPSSKRKENGELRSRHETKENGYYFPSNKVMRMVSGVLVMRIRTMVTTLLVVKTRRVLATL